MAQNAIMHRVTRAQESLRRAEKKLEQIHDTSQESSSSGWTQAEEDALANAILALSIAKQDVCTALDLAEADYADCLNQQSGP